nr:hypothetical protein [Actinopolymorpha cephalotaxi]
MVPELAGANADELAGVRSAARSAVRQLLAAGPDLVVCVGAAPAADTVLTWGTTATGSLAPYGVDVRVGASSAAGGAERPGEEAKPELPLAHTVGAWLLDSCGYTGERRYVGVPDCYDSAGAADLGATLAATTTRTSTSTSTTRTATRSTTTGTGRTGRVGLLVMGDGSARRDQHAPGAADPRAPKLDALVATSLGTGDLDGLRGLRPDLARELLVAGRAAWQVLAGAADAAVTAGRRLEPRLLADEAPCGVGYFVAYWRLLD